MLSSNYFIIDHLHTQNHRWNEKEEEKKRKNVEMLWKQKPQYTSLLCSRRLLLIAKLMATVQLFSTWVEN